MFFLKLTKDIAESTEILAPLKAACGATISLLEEVEVCVIYYAND